MVCTYRLTSSLARIFDELNMGSSTNHTIHVLISNVEIDIEAIHNANCEGVQDILSHLCVHLILLLVFLIIFLRVTLNAC